MAAFYFTASPKVVSADGNPWIDPSSALPNPYFNALATEGLDSIPSFPKPSRQNNLLGIPHRYDKFKVNKQINVQLNPTGTVGLVLDGALGGNLFLATFAEVPIGSFAWSSVPGISAQQFFFPTVTGAYCAVFSRGGTAGVGGSGGIIWHFQVEP